MLGGPFLVPYSPLWSCWVKWPRYNWCGNSGWNLTFIYSFVPRRLQGACFFLFQGHWLVLKKEKDHLVYSFWVPTTLSNCVYFPELACPIFTKWGDEFLVPKETATFQDYGRHAVYWKAGWLCGLFMAFIRPLGRQIPKVKEEWWQRWAPYGRDNDHGLLPSPSYQTQNEWILCLVLTNGVNQITIFLLCKLECSEYKNQPSEVLGSWLGDRELL